MEAPVVLYAGSQARIGPGTTPGSGITVGYGWRRRFRRWRGHTRSPSMSSGAETIRDATKAMAASVTAIHSAAR